MLIQPDSTYSILSNSVVRFGTSDSDVPLPLIGQYVSERSPGDDVEPDLNILIVDDHPMYRSALESLVRALSPSRTTIAVGTLKAMADEVASGKHFKCVFLDLDLPDSQGLNSLQQTKALIPDVPIYILSGHASELVRNQCMQAGATLFIGKTIQQDELIRTLQSLLAETPVKMGERLTNETGNMGIPPRNRPRKVRPVLSARQFEILVLIAEGRSNEQIGEQLNIALGTVKTHVSKILSGLGVQNRQEAAAVLASIRKER